MKHNFLLIVLLMTIVGAGGVPLAPDMPHRVSKLLEETRRSIQRQRDWQKTMDKIIPVYNEPYDPEYVAILEEYDRRKESFRLSHRDLQWHIVAKVMRDIDELEERLGLIRTVRENPLWRQLPPTVAITPLNLANWNTAKKMFMKHLRKAK